jgi:Holliday junction resolvase-like predicted endonuclease
MVELEEIESLARKFSIEDVLEKYDWKEFEKIVAEIFKRNNFSVKKNFRFNLKKKYEVDVLAARGKFVFCVDCKRWSGGRYKKSGIRKSAEEQEKRTEEVKKFLEKNPMLRNVLNVSENFKIYPLIVTLMEEDLIQEKNTFVVPVFKLNSFLLNLESYLY